MYNEAKEVYKKWGVDAEDAIKRCAAIPDFFILAVNDAILSGERSRFIT